VPHYAISGGALTALAANEILMCEHSVLGPIDPQLGDSPAASFIKVVEQKPMAKIDDKTLIMADVGRKAIMQVKQAASELLTRHLPAEQATALAELSAGIWTHDYPIWASTRPVIRTSLTVVNAFYRADMLDGMDPIRRGASPCPEARPLLPVRYAAN
jgi:ClpP class serine protease